MAVLSPPSLNAGGLSPAVTLGVFPRALLCPFLWAEAPSDHVLTGFGGTGEIRDLQTPELKLLAALANQRLTPFRRVLGGVHLDIMGPLILGAQILPAVALLPLAEPDDLSHRMRWLSKKSDSNWYN